MCSEFGSRLGNHESALRVDVSSLDCLLEPSSEEVAGLLVKEGQGGAAASTSLSLK